MGDIHITALYGAISALTAAIAWLSKLFYVDVKQALSDCEARHDKTKLEYEQRLQEERAECKSDLKEHKDVINNLQTQVNTLMTSVLELKSDSAVLKSKP